MDSDDIDYYYLENLFNTHTKVNSQYNNQNTINICLSNIFKNLQCSICLCYIKNAVTVSCCATTYCTTCITNWINHNNNCPMCRKKISCANVENNKAMQKIVNEVIYMEIKLGNLTRINISCSDIIELCDNTLFNKLYKSMIDQLDTEGNNLLIACCIKNKLNWVKDILKLNIFDINYQNQLGYTALMYCREESHLNVAKLLLKNKQINLNVQNKQNHTILGFACKFNNLKLINILMNMESIDVSIKSVDYTYENKTTNTLTPLWYAVETKNYKMIQILLKRCNVQNTLWNQRCETILNFACWNNDINIIKLIWPIYKDLINIPDKDNITPLASLLMNENLTCDQEFMTLIKQIIKMKSVNINYQTTKGNSVIMLCCRNKYIDVFKYLIKHCPEIDITLQNNKKETVLSLVCENKVTEALKILIKHKDIQSILYKFSMHGDKNYNNTPFGICIFYECIDLIPLLLSIIDYSKIKNLKVNKEMPLLFHLCCDKSLKLINLLLPICINDSCINYTHESSGNTVLTCLLLRKFDDVVFSLLRNTEVNVNVINKNGLSPIIIACQNNNFEIANMLLNKGAKFIMKSPDTINKDNVNEITTRMSKCIQDIIDNKNTDERILNMILSNVIINTDDTSE